MGVCYKLLRDDKKEAFDLDKGWGGFLPYDEDTFLPSYDVAVLGKMIREQVYPHLDDAYCTLVARRLIAWCGDAIVRLINDSFSHEEDETYKVTADRFSPSYVPGYEDYVPENQR